MSDALMDRLEIADLVSRLGAVLDEGRFAEMPELFVEHATARTPGGVAQGRDSVVAQAERNHGPDLNVQHVITNVLVDVDGDRAHVRANLIGSFAPADPADIAPPVQYMVGQVYGFDVVRTAAGWRFTAVDTTPVWMSGTRPAIPPAK